MQPSDRYAFRLASLERARLAADRDGDAPHVVRVQEIIHEDRGDASLSLLIPFPAEVATEVILLVDSDDAPVGLLRIVIGPHAQSPVLLAGVEEATAVILRSSALLVASIQPLSSDWRWPEDGVVEWSYWY